MYETWRCGSWEWLAPEKVPMLSLPICFWLDSCYWMCWRQLSPLSSSIFMYSCNWLIMDPLVSVRLFWRMLASHYHKNSTIPWYFTPIPFPDSYFMPNPYLKCQLLSGRLCWQHIAVSQVSITYEILLQPFPRSHLSPLVVVDALRRPAKLE